MPFPVPSGNECSVTSSGASTSVGTSSAWFVGSSLSIMLSTRGTGLGYSDGPSLGSAGSVYWVSFGGSYVMTGRDICITISATFKASFLHGTKGSLFAVWLTLLTRAGPCSLCSLLYA